MAKTRSLLIPILFFATGGQVSGQPSGMVTARVALEEARALCSADRGHLWGRDLCGPTMIVNPSDRRVVANRGDTQNVLSADAGLFTGLLPPDIGIANTAVRWQGIQWIMLRGPLPADRTDRAILLMHESWHRVQADLGLQAREAAQGHLVTPEGRIALRLELRALAAAIEQDGAAARQALRDALAFRAWRYARFPAAAAEEAALELNEGLAEYTGWTLAGAATDRPRLARHVRKGDRATSLVRSFAYFTGPAYGVLLDHLAPNWKSHLSFNSTLTGQMPAAIAANSVSDADFERRGSRFGLADLRREEVEAARVAAEARAHWRARLVDGPTLTIPSLGANVVFDPNAVFPLDQLGNVHPRLQANGPWGTLDVTDGVLLRGDWSALIVAAERPVVAGTEASTAGWHLQLAPGWSLRRGENGKWQLVQQPPQHGEAR